MNVNLALFFLLVPLQRKPTAPNDLRGQSKTKDSLHPPGRAGPRASGGELYPLSLNFNNLIRNTNCCWRYCEGKERWSGRIRLENHKPSMSLKWEKCIYVCRGKMGWLRLVLPGNAWLAFLSSTADLACWAQADWHSLASGQDSFHCQYETEFLIRWWHSYLRFTSPLKAGCATLSSWVCSGGELHAVWVLPIYILISSLNHYFWSMLVERITDKCM